jgi:hypothetical protein
LDEEAVEDDVGEEDGGVSDLLLLCLGCLLSSSLDEEEL